MSPPVKICAVLTAFNRREQTVDALRFFFRQGQGMDLTAVLTDDDSTDGTTAAVQVEFRELTDLSSDMGADMAAGLVSDLSSNA